jgi:hypothetical protein
MTHKSNTNNPVDFPKLETEMNERIRELAEQATKKYDRLGNEIPFAQPDLEKFAELIVMECISIVEPTQHHKAFAQGYVGGVDGLELLDSKVKKIKQHFGVEE